jgi:hypothetical protein
MPTETAVIGVLVLEVTASDVSECMCCMNGQGGGQKSRLLALMNV